MLVVFLLMSLLYYEGNSMQIPVQKPVYNDQLINCVTGIVWKYFAGRKGMTYVGNKNEDAELLRAIHAQNTITIVSRPSSKKLLVPHEGYLISPRNATYIAGRIPNLTRDSTWNPNAPFLFIIRGLNETELKIVFDSLLKVHVINVLVVNATEDADLYTYNPFDNYHCGRRYDSIISFGKCRRAHSLNLYPEKIVTGLRNCTINALITQWPPYTILINESDKSSQLDQGAEPYILRLIGKMEGFEVNIMNDYDHSEDFPTVSVDMEAKGLLKKLQDNEADVILGGMLLTPSRAVAFSYIYGHLAYTDEIRFVVKLASYVPPWKNIYLEFQSTVWVLLILAFIFYSMLIIVLLRTKDKSYVVLKLLDNLVLHGYNIKCRLTIKCVLIFWVWFAYLVNTFYQSSLVSLTTNPAQEYQISKEEDIAKYQLKPCFSSIMAKYYVETVQSDNLESKTDGCSGLLESVRTVTENKDAYTIILYGLYLYNEHDFFDEYGRSQAFTLPKPYSKVMFSIYMYKGFPLIDRLRHHSLQLRENGLVNKLMSDMNYLNKIKHRFRKKEFRGGFAIPWLIYIFGCIISVITFFVEVVSKNY